MNVATNFCSKTAKQKSPPAETRPGTEPKKRLGKHPQHAADDLARRVFSGATILFNVQHVCSSDCVGGAWATADYADHADFYKPRLRME